MTLLWLNKKSGKKQTSVTCIINYLYKISVCVRVRVCVCNNTALVSSLYFIAGQYIIIREDKRDPLCDFLWTQRSTG